MYIVTVYKISLGFRLISFCQITIRLILH